MTLLDHRILISVPVEAAWEQIASLHELPKWHANCTSTSILTTSQRGAGVRRRNTMRNGPATVEEIVKWYEGLGYEYVIVDGVPFERNQGRIRLQATPEGTVVQWTFEYELTGLVSGLRNTLTIRRRIEKEIIDSLLNLKKLLDAKGVRLEQADRDKVLMRPAPSATERAKLGAEVFQQHEKPTAFTSPSPVVPAETARFISPPPMPTLSGNALPAILGDDDLPPLLAEEPPISIEDTKPSPSVALDSDATDSTAQASPAPDDARFRPPAEPSAVPEGLPFDATPLTFSPLPPFEDSYDDLAPTSQTPRVETVDIDAALSVFDMAVEPVPQDRESPADSGPDLSSFDDSIFKPPALSVAAQETYPAPPPPPAKRRAEVSGPSIWEVFGVRPPSASESEVEDTPLPTDTQESLTVRAPDSAAPDSAQEEAPALPDAPVNMPLFASAVDIVAGQPDEQAPLTAFEPLSLDGIGALDDTAQHPAVIAPDQPAAPAAGLRQQIARSKAGIRARTRRG